MLGYFFKYVKIIFSMVGFRLAIQAEVAFKQKKAASGYLWVQWIFQSKTIGQLKINKWSA